MLTGIESAKLKIERATVHINALRDEVLRYTGSQPDRVIKEPNGKQKVVFAQPPPAEISILAGEILYQLRSALDHLAFDLVKLNPSGGTLPPKWGSRCRFPLLLEIPTKGNPPVLEELPLYYGFFDKLPGISKQAHTFIERIQPYNGFNTSIRLRWLAKLSNLDRHRHLNLAAPQAYCREVFPYENGSAGLALYRTINGAPLKSRFPSEVNVYRSVIPFVTFNEPTLDLNADTFPIEGILQSCADEVKTIIIPTFEKLINNP